jgi:hypothetical protein
LGPRNPALGRKLSGPRKRDSGIATKAKLSALLTDAVDECPRPRHLADDPQIEATAIAM